MTFTCLSDVVEIRVEILYLSWSLFNYHVQTRKKLRLKDLKTKGVNRNRTTLHEQNDMESSMNVIKIKDESF